MRILFAMTYSFFVQAQTPWFETQQKWDPYNENHISKKEITFHHLKPLLQIIEQSSYDNLIEQALKQAGLKNREDLTQFIYACKFEINNGEYSVEQSGETHSPEESTFYTEGITYDNFIKLNSLQTKKEKKSYILKEIFNKENFSISNYEVKVGELLFQQREVKNESFVCISHHLSKESAASTLVHELVHFVSPEHLDVSLETLYQKSKFLDAFYYQTGGEMDAFMEQCSFELEMSQIYKEGSMCESFIQQGVLDKEKLEKEFRVTYKFDAIYARYTLADFIYAQAAHNLLSLRLLHIQNRTRLRAAQRAGNIQIQNFISEQNQAAEKEILILTEKKERALELLDIIEKELLQ